MAKKFDTLKEVEAAFNMMGVCLAIFMLACVFAVASWGWFLLTYYDNVILTLGGWATLFYLFSASTYIFWLNVLVKNKKNDRDKS